MLQKERKKYAAVFKNCRNGSSLDTFLQRISWLYGEWRVLIIECKVSSLQILLLNTDIVQSQKDLLKVNAHVWKTCFMFNSFKTDFINNRRQFFLTTHYVLNNNTETKKLHTGKCQCTVITGLSSTKLGKSSLYQLLVVLKWLNLIIYGY